LLGASQLWKAFYALAFALALPATAALATEGHSEAIKTCGNLLGEDAHAPNAELALELEEHKLVDLLDPNPATNLAVKHPAIVMNAFQRAKSWLHYRKPYYTTVAPYFLTQVRIFPVLSDGIEEADGKRIVGQFKQAEAFGNYVERGAAGDGSSSKMPVFVGPPGTAKTEFLNILNRLAQNLQTNVPDYFNYTYEWRGLEEIPELKPIVIAFGSEEQGGTYHFPLACPLGDSPFVLLPKKAQDKLIELATPRVRALINLPPNPWRPMCPHCQYVANKVLAHEARKSGTSNLSVQQTVEALSKYVRIIRRVIGRGGKVPKIDAQGKDVDYAGLFVSPNPLVKSIAGPDNPFSYFLNGKIAGMHGGIGCFDEYWRNDPALRDALLELVENRVISRGGSVAVPLDMVVIGASNTESVTKALDTQQARAQMDRTTLIQMPYSLVPHEIAKTALLMKNPEQIEAIPLTAPADNGPATPAPVSLDELFPAPKSGLPFEGPDRRYKVWVKDGDQRVHISPHTLLYMSMVTSATRLNIDSEAAARIGSKVVVSALFRNPIQRLKVLTGRLPATPGELRELEELSEHLRDGHQGLSMRDSANIWLTQSIAEALKPGNGNCLTPSLARRVFLRLLREKTLQCPSYEKQAEWVQLADDIAFKLLLPAIDEDLELATGGADGRAEAVYDELRGEIEALDDDPNAREYRGAEDEVRPINLERLAEIRQLFVEEHGRPLASDLLVKFHASPSANRGVPRRHDGLMTVIRRYLAKNARKSVGTMDLSRLLSAGATDAPTREFADRVQHAMIHKLGYCERCMRSAFDLQSDMLRRQANTTPGR
jgi:predicted Ser/Thr protein kinase